MIKVFKQGKGSITLEASIVLPLFICILISVIYLIKLVYTHELVQHAIDEAAWEVASSAYVYRASELKEAEALIKNNLAGIFGDDEEISGLFSGIAADALANKAKAELFVPVAQMYTAKYIAQEGLDADSRLRMLNIKNGISGMDFSQSGFLQDSEENVEIVVSYEMELPLPVNILPDLKIVQRAVSKAWLSGDEPSEDDEEADDIWLLGNLERGTKIRTIFGANLPYSFPVISSFESGKAILIKSMDLTDESYQYAFNVRETLEGYIDELAGFRGQETPWGSKKIVISSKAITARQLILVIPENELLPEVEQMLGICASYASGRGVELKVVRYGLKQTSNSESG